MPGAGSTRHLTQAIGKARAMELILTGRMLTAGGRDPWPRQGRAGESTVPSPRSSSRRSRSRLPPVAVRAAKAAILDPRRNVTWEVSPGNVPRSTELFGTRIKPRGWPPFPKAPARLVGALAERATGGRHGRKTPGRVRRRTDYERDLGDELPASCVIPRPASGTIDASPRRSSLGLPGAGDRPARWPLPRAGLGPRPRPDLPGLPPGSGRSLSR